MNEREKRGRREVKLKDSLTERELEREGGRNSERLTERQ